MSIRRWEGVGEGGEVERGRLRKETGGEGAKERWGE